MVFFSQISQRTQIKEVFLTMCCRREEQLTGLMNEDGEGNKRGCVLRTSLSLSLSRALLIYRRQNTNLWSRLPLIHRLHNWNLTSMLSQTVSLASKMPSIFKLASTGWVTVLLDFERNTSFQGTVVELVRQFAPLSNVPNLMSQMSKPPRCSNWIQRTLTQRGNVSILGEL